MTDAPTLPLREDAPVASPSRRPAAPPAWPTRVLLDSVYGVSALFVALPFFVVVVVGLALSVALAVLLVGVLVLAATVYLARAQAFLERLRLQGMVRWAAPTPTYQRAPEGSGFWRRSVTPLRDPQSWLDVLWSLVSPITAALAFSLVVAWWGVV